MLEPKYDEDTVNLGYLKKVISDTEEEIDNTYKNVSRHYASRPQPPYYKGDTWIDGDIVYTCINTRTIGLYQNSDWVTESGAKTEAERKNKTYLTQPSNYNPGDMWILQTDEDHRAGQKGEILISTAGRKEYNEDDWVNMLGYGTIKSINEVAGNLNNAINRIGNVEEAIQDGLIITFYQDTVPEGIHLGDLWYVTGEIEGYIQGKIYRYDGTNWIILNDPAIQEAFDEANEARLVADGKIQSFYSETEPTQNMGVGDLWIDLSNNNQLYRYNGTNWVAVYDTRINELVTTVETVTERVATIETDLGEIDLKVKETTTKITTIEGDIDNVETLANNAQSTADNAVEGVNNITNTQGEAEGKNIHIEDSAEEPFVEVELYGESIQEGIPTPDSPREIENLEGKNRLKNIYEAGYTTTINGVTFTVNKDKSVSIKGTATADAYLYLNSKDIASYTEKIKKGTYTLSGCSSGSSSTYMLGIILKKQDSTGGQYITSRTGTVKTTISDGDNAYYSYILVKSGATVDTTIYPQLEEGVATPYVPYNSLEFKVEGKNIFDCANSRIIYNNGDASYERLDNGLKPISNGAQYNMIYFLVDTVKNLKDKTLTLSSDISFSKDNQLTSFGLYYTDTNGGNRKAIVDNSHITSEGKYQVTGQVKEGENRYYVCIGLRPNMASNFASGDYTIYDNLQVEISETATNYEPYKSQVATFPLGEEKLMEGSYLADDGIHHKRKQYVFKGTEYFLVQPQTNDTDLYIAHHLSGLKTRGNLLSNYFLQGLRLGENTNKIGALYSTYLYFGIPLSTIGATASDNYDVKIQKFKEWLATQYANGTPVIVEYDLAEPETVPYTEEQQEAWNKIKALMTYKNITNITSDAYAKVIYMRDNGLDVYETKQNAQKRYTETSEKLTEQKMTVDGVITQVSETNKRLTNDYLTAEQVNAELDTTKEDIEIIKQNQVTMTQTSKNLQIAIDTINNEGVTKVKTSMGYTFDDEGMKTDKEGEPTGTIINEAAVQVIDKTGSSRQNLLYAGYVKEGNTDYPAYIGQTIVASANMIVRNYLVVPNSRFEEYTNPVLGGKGTGAFEV